MTEQEKQEKLLNLLNQITSIAEEAVELLALSKQHYQTYILMAQILHKTDNEINKIKVNKIGV